MNTLLTDIFNSPRLSMKSDMDIYWNYGDSLFSPNIDIIETDKAYKLYVDLPGIPKKDIKIEIENNKLCISGERKCDYGEDDICKRSERLYGKFQRTFSLHDSIDKDNLTAEYTDGVLVLTINKNPDYKKTISVK